MTASPHRCWLGLAPLALLLALLLGAAAPGGAAAPERGIGAGHRLAGAGGTRVARLGSAPRAILEAAHSRAGAGARPHGAPAAALVRIAAPDEARAALPRAYEAPTCALPSRPRAYDPRGPPSTTA
jgi:hypothetical protein